MSIRILTQNGIENTNLDGARANNFNSGRRSGIVKGALNEGNLFSVSSNTIALDTCELRLCGHRIVLDSIEYKTLINIPKTASRYSLVAQVIVDDNRDVSFALIIQSALISLVQDNLDVSGKGKFELEIGRFTQQVDGSITDIVRTADLITGGISGKTSEWTVGEVTTNTIGAGVPANVDIDYNEDTNAYDFQFDIPKGIDGNGQTNVKVAGVVQTEVNFESDPQSQINDVTTDINTKANLDASNLSGENVTSWGNKLGINTLTTELENRAKSDASNLTNENVASWANKLGCENVENVETIYDKDSTDADINWGYTSGLQGVTIANKNFTKYKILRIYYCNKNGSIENDSWGRNNIIELDLTKHINFDYSTSNQLRYINYTQSNNGGIIVKVNSDKTSFAVVITDNVNSSSDSYVYKIEGVY